MKKNGYKRLISLLLVMSILFYCGSSAMAAGKFDDVEENETEVLNPEEAEISTRAGRRALVLQGNTVRASDCHAIYNGLMSRYTINTVGWTWNGTNSYSENYQRATANDFLQAGQYTFAYYSGHGSRTDGIPKLNANASSTYGAYSPFDVSALLGVNTSDWRNSCSWKDWGEINVLMLAACYQLDSSIVKYYARAMRASDIRAIAGYNESAPVHETDTNIANQFISLAEAGNSVWYSWQHANWNTTNGYQPWAVLVYTENANQYYRIPGFPGNTYPTPSANAAVFRYADFLDGPSAVGFSSSPVVPENISAEITLSFSNSSSPTFVTQREVAESGNVMQSSELFESKIVVADEYVSNILSNDNLSNSVCMEESVIREEVDPDDGIVEGTAQTVEKVYTYYNTYNGIKILDDFIKVGVDCNGVNTVLNNWRELSNNEVAACAETTFTPLLASNALDIALSNANANADGEIISQMLAYYPIGNGTYRLCYEYIIDGSVYYIDAETGDYLNEA